MKNSSMKKNADLYSTTDTYECHLFQDENEWKANRIKGIGGSAVKGNVIDIFVEAPRQEMYYTEVYINE